MNESQDCPKIPREPIDKFTIQRGGISMLGHSEGSDIWKIWIIIIIIGMIKMKTEDHIKRIPWNPCLQELRKIVLNGTAHLLLCVLSM